MRTTRIAGVQVSRLCIGGNPFSGFSHQSSDRDKEMREYFTPERIHELLRNAEEAGINTVFARTDDHIISVLQQYWASGGRIQWFAQVCSDTRESDSWKQWMGRAAELGAKALYIHGGIADYWHAQGYFDRFREALALMRGYGKAAGFAGHRPEVHEWVRDHLAADFQMCSYYNPTDRSRNPAHSGIDEKWHVGDRSRMLAVVKTLTCPAVHYKVFGGGNRPIAEAFETMGRAVRDGDVVCIGLFPKDDPGVLVKDIEMFEEYVEGKHVLAEKS
jgi:hypothetical protein